MDKKQSDFQKETIKILRPVETERGTELAVVRWIKDGKAYPPQLVNQEVYTDRLDKSRKYGKQKGLKWGDFKLLIERKDEILELLLDFPESLRKPRAAGAGKEAAANDRPPYEDEKDQFF